MTPGLRERKRRQIAHELARAAFDLTAEKGINGFTIDELTDKAGYARRTFTNYYSCKEDAVTALALEQLHAGLTSLPEAPDQVELIDWISALAKHQFSSGLMDVLLNLEALAEANPSLEPYLARVYTQIRMTAWQLVHDRFAGDVTPQQISILVGSVYGALSMILTQAPLASSDGETSIDSGFIADYLDTVFDQLKSGF